MGPGLLLTLALALGTGPDLEADLRALDAGLDVCKIRLDECRQIDRTMTATVVLRPPPPSPREPIESPEIPTFGWVLILVGSVIAAGAIGTGLGYATGRLSD